ncbi:MAG: tRNA lysidine(34) synthetase TilS [Gammaproteobacteria bacterium]
MLGRLARELERFSSEAAPAGWCVALSGGADSVALLVALSQLRRSARWRRVPLRAVHVHHGLRLEAEAWARHCRALCRRLRIPLSVRRVTVPRTRGTSLEAEARRVRYEALSKGLRRDEWLLTAHHEDDQLETLLLQWMRGAGVAGLAAMPLDVAFGKGRLMRPLLSESRAQLEAFVRAQGFAWVEDDSNVDERFDRNFLRRRVLPLLRERWPAAARVASRSASHLGEARALLEVLAAQDLATVTVDEGLIDLAKLAEFDAARQRNLLRHWLQTRGLAMPDAVHLERIRVELAAARRDASPSVRWTGGEVRRFRGRLYAMRAVAASAAAPASAARDRRAWRWRKTRRFELVDGQGALRLVADAHGPIDAALLPAVLWVGVREGGEKLALEAGGPRHALKELLRVATLPPWERPRLPILFDRKADTAAVVAVADLLVAAPFRAAGHSKGAKGRLRLVWEGRFC